jgi:hypothetical protein
VSAAQIRVSLALWERRHAFRQKQLDVAHAKNDAKAITKWYRLLTEAGSMIRHRREQLVARQSTGQVWMDEARKLPRASAGGWALSCPAKGVLHTTEGLGDATSTLDANGDHPHFQVERDGRITQYIPVDQAAKALKHVGAPETNRAHAVQIEVVGRAANPAWPAEQKAAVRKVMRFIEANAGVERASHVRFAKAANVRLTGPEWLDLRGWCGHQHVPNNDHTDPGAIKIGELL